MATEVFCNTSHNGFPMMNDIRCRTLALSLGDPVDEAAADAKKQQQLEEEEERQKRLRKQSQPQPHQLHLHLLPHLQQQQQLPHSQQQQQLPHSQQQQFLHPQQHIQERGHSQPHQHPQEHTHQERGHSQPHQHPQEHTHHENPHQRAHSQPPHPHPQQHPQEHPHHQQPHQHPHQRAHSQPPHPHQHEHEHDNQHHHGPHQQHAHQQPHQPHQQQHDHQHQQPHQQHDHQQPHHQQHHQQQKHHHQVEEQESIVCESPRSVLISSAQMGSYHPVEDKIYLNATEKLYGIFDGHGGDICSKYISEKVPKLVLDKLARQLSRSSCGVIDYSCVLKSSFIEADTCFLNEHKFMLKNSPTGSCGVVVLEREGYLYVCNLGDSRVQLGKTDESGKFSTVVLTNDHNTTNPKEVQLVLERTSDPFPIRANITSNTEGKRVGGVLMLTRAFGDGVFKRRDMSMPPFISHLPYITSEPEVNVHKIEPQDQFVIIASDGLYELLTPDQITCFVGELLLQCKDSPSEFAKIGAKLLDKVVEKIASLMRKTVEEVRHMPNKKSFMDDTTVIVLLLNR